MYKTSRKGQSAFSRRGRDIINSRRVNRKVNQERQLIIKQNELDMEQLHLIEDIVSNIIENGDQNKFLKYKQPLSKDEIEEIYDILPKRNVPPSMNRHLKNPLFLSALLLTVLTTIVSQVEAKWWGHETPAKIDLVRMEDRLETKIRQLESQNKILMEQLKLILEILQNK
jgi:hypothetical protein